MPSSPRSPLRAAVLGGLLVVGIAGCRATDPPAAAPLDAATGAVLADAADRLASALEAGDHCQTLTEVEHLEARAEAARQAGDAPEEVVAETVRVARAVTAGVACGGEPVSLDDAGDGATPDGATPDDAAPDDAAVEVEAAPAEPPAPPPPAEDTSATADEADRGGNGSSKRGNGSNSGGNGSNSGGNGNDGNGNGNGNEGGGSGNGRGNGGRG